MDVLLTMIGYYNILVLLLMVIARFFDHSFFDNALFVVGFAIHILKKSVINTKVPALILHNTKVL